MDTLNDFINITKFIENIYNFRLKEFINNNQYLCELSINFFNVDELPDYTKEHVQESYLLKYSLAYSFEFYRMYNKIIDSLKDKGYINVLSLGCGSCIDYWSLCYTLYKKNINTKINYIGVDKIKWESNGIEEPFDKNNCETNYKFNKRRKDNSYFLQSEIKDLENSININNKCNEINNILSNLDIIIFPRSIGDICDNEENNEILKNIFNKAKNDKIFFLSSTFNQRDLNLFSNIIDNMLNKLNIIKIKEEKMLCFEDAGGISAIDSYFQYPDNIKEIYKDLCKYKDVENKNCVKYDKDCSINESPILHSNKIKYSYCIFGKNNDNKRK